MAYFYFAVMGKGEKFQMFTAKTSLLVPQRFDEEKIALFFQKYDKHILDKSAENDRILSKAIQGKEEILL